MSKKIKVTHFSLSLLLGLLLTSIGLAQSLSKEHKQASQLLQKLGARVSYGAYGSDRTDVSLEKKWRGTTKDLAALRNLRKLGHLLIRSSVEVDTELLSLVGSLKDLSYLSLPGLGIDNAAFAELETLKSLESLELSAAKQEIYWDDGALATIGEMQNLRSLNLGNDHLTGDGLVHLKTLKSLEFLWLKSDALKGPSLVHLGKLPRLRTLNIKSKTVNSTDMAHLTELTGLRDFSPPRGRLDDKGMPYLASMTQLSRLILAYSPITDKGVTFLKGMNHLSELDLSRTNVSGGTLDQLRCKNLKTLRLNGSHMTDTNLVHLKNFPNLEYLDIRSTKITDSGLLQIAGLKNLKVLDLGDNTITDIGLVHVKGLTGLTYLGLKKTKVSPGAVEELKKSLPKLGELRYP